MCLQVSSFGMILAWVLTLDLQCVGVEAPSFYTQLIAGCCHGRMEKFINCLSASVEMVLLQLYSLGSYGALKNHLQIFFSDILSIFKNVSLESNCVLVEATYYLLKNICFLTWDLRTWWWARHLSSFSILFFFPVSFLVHGFLLKICLDVLACALLVLSLTGHCSMACLSLLGLWLVSLELCVLWQRQRDPLPLWGVRERGPSGGLGRWWLSGWQHSLGKHQVLG